MKLEFKPHAKQRLILKALAYYLVGAIVMVIAGRRFGKTVLAVNEIAKRAIEIPGARIWYVAPTKDQAYSIAWRLMLRERIDESGKRHPPYLPAEVIRKIRGDRHFIELWNGSLIEFKGTQDEVFLLGAGLHFVVFDEFPTIPWSVWEDTVRPMLLDFNGDALFIATVPDPKVHRISTEFIEMYEKLLFGNGEKYEKAFNFSSFDNPYINKKKIERDIEDLKRKGREADAERLYHGKYTREYGLIFPKFNYDDHTVIPFEIPGNWLKVMAADPHPQKPINALWAAIDQRDHVWVYRECEFRMATGRPMTVQEAAYDIIFQEDTAKEKVKARLMDPTYAKIQQNIIGQKCIMDLFREHGLHFREASRDFMPFFNELTNRLVEVPDPTFHVFRTCPDTIRQLSNYGWDSWASGRARAEKGVKNKPKAVDDDYVDCLKYIINASLKNVDMQQVAAFKQRLRDKWENKEFM